LLLLGRVVMLARRVVDHERHMNGRYRGKRGRLLLPMLVVVVVVVVVFFVAIVIAA
jgi:uncharacterized membrane protein